MGPRLLFPIETTLKCMDMKIKPRLACPLAEIKDENERHVALDICSAKLLLAVRQQSHFEALDKVLASLLPGVFSYPSAKSCSPPETLPSSLSITARAAVDIIARLPSTPRRFCDLPLFSKPAHLNDIAYVLGGAQGLPPDEVWITEYVLPEGHPKPRPEHADVLAHLNSTLNLAWNNMWVTTFMDRNSTLLALLIAQRGMEPDMEFAEAFAKYVDLISKLLNQHTALIAIWRTENRKWFQENYTNDELLGHALFPDAVDRSTLHKQQQVVEIFLWTAWHRSTMLFFYYIIGVQINRGTQDDFAKFLAIRGVRRLDDIGSNGADYGVSNAYMCSWAFQILRTNRSALAQDFRQLLSRFDHHFKNRPGRCMGSAKGNCGDDDGSVCRRFIDSEHNSQSVHDKQCDMTCTRKTWNENSYFRLRDGRAVDIYQDSNMLEYTIADSQTLAISHVWSHGQGGRPETGINSCLHKRYYQLAKMLGCRSYWIDAACIPSENAARQQAIKMINNIFRTSKATLIIDVDLLSVDITKYKENEVEIAETLLSILLVCDWNVRAWTMLEAMRSSQSLYILCSGDRIIRLHDILSSVIRKGSISLALLLGSAQHLLPAPPDTNISAEKGGALLSRRHASKQLDEIVIWGLLCGIAVPKDAAQFWRSQEKVRTGFLLSSAPRITGTRTLNWAPATPYTRTQQRAVEVRPGIQQRYMVRFPAYDGDGSIHAMITKEGLLGRWRYMSIDQEKIADMAEVNLEMSESWLYDGVSLHNEYGKVLRPDADNIMCFAHSDEAHAQHLMTRLLHEGAMVRYIRPVAEDGSSPYSGAMDRGEQFGLVGAVCASLDQGETWRWQAVHCLQEPDDDDEWMVGDMIIT